MPLLKTLICASKTSSPVECQAAVPEWVRRADCPDQPLLWPWPIEATISPWQNTLCTNAFSFISSTLKLYNYDLLLNLLRSLLSISSATRSFGNCNTLLLLYSLFCHRHDASHSGPSRCHCGRAYGRVGCQRHLGLRRWGKDAESVTIGASMHGT